MSSTQTVPPPAETDEIEGVTLVEDLDTFEPTSLTGCGDDNPYR